MKLIDVCEHLEQTARTLVAENGLQSGTVYFLLLTHFLSLVLLTVLLSFLCYTTILLHFTISLVSSLFVLLSHF